MQAVVVYILIGLAVLVVGLRIYKIITNKYVYCFNIEGGAQQNTVLTANIDEATPFEIMSAREYSGRQNYDESWLSARLGADYLVNRWMSVFANIMWEQEWCGNGNNDYDYDRFRGTLGVRFHY